MRLHLGGYLPFFSSTKLERIEVPLKGPSLLSEILSNLGVPVSDVYLTILNGELVTLEDTLVNDSDEVKVYPPIDGG
jgi:sulfur carrier protein ThiS